MKLVHSTISRKELHDMAAAGFGNLVKAVVDINKKIMVIDASLHSDEEAYLIKHGSNQSHLWGINIYPDLNGDDFIEFDSMINLRPSQNNLSRGVVDTNIQKQIRTVVTALIK